MAEAYKVISIDELSKLNETKQGLERYYRHRIKTKGGVVLTVDVEARDFNAKKAAPILLKAATEADEVLAL